MLYAQLRILYTIPGLAGGVHVCDTWLELGCETAGCVGGITGCMGGITGCEGGRVGCVGGNVCCEADIEGCEGGIGAPGSGNPIFGGTPSAEIDETKWHCYYLDGKEVW